MPASMARPARICDGIGLARSEFLRMALGPGDPATVLPDEDTQSHLDRDLLCWAEGRPVTVRSLDLGGDTPLPDSLRWRSIRPWACAACSCRCCIPRAF